MDEYHLAQLSIARFRAPLEDPRMAEFVARLEAVFALAESADGFVWRLKPDDATAQALRAASDPLLAVTLSVWESVGALRAFVYQGAHRAALRQRADWFAPWPGENIVLWWLPRGARPRVEQGMARLKYLERHGPSPKAFSIRTAFPAPGPSKDNGAGLDAA